MKKAFSSLLLIGAVASALTPGMTSAKNLDIGLTGDANVKIKGDNGLHLGQIKKEIKANATTVVEADSTDVRKLFRDDRRDDDREKKAKTVVGTVVSVNTSTRSFVIATKDQRSLTVNTTASTTVQKNGAVASWTDVVVGSQVNVKGIWNQANATIVANSINVIFRTQPIFFRGTVTAKTDTTLTVERLGNKVVYSVDVAKSMILNRLYQIIRLANVAVGDQVQIGGTHVNNSTQVTAFMVRDTTTSSTAQ